MSDVLASHPDVLTALDEAHRAAWSATDPRLLELCRVRVAQLIGCAAEADVVTPAGVDRLTHAEVANWPTSDCFDERDRAVLAWCEMFVIDVAALDDATVAEVTDHLGADGLARLTNAVLVIEQRQRLRLTWERLSLVHVTPAAGARGLR